MNTRLESAGQGIRNDWQADEILAIYQQSLMDLLFEAQTVHRRFFNPNEVQLSTLVNVKTGACPEDCSYCSQSARYDAGLKPEKLISVDRVTAAAKKAREQGASRFCMGAAWREPKDKDMPEIEAMVRSVKALGMETCMTLGMLSDSQAMRLKAAGLDYYNHNIDTSEDYYDKVVTTRTFGDRLETLDKVRKAGINVCCGGILGLGESRSDRISMLQTLSNLPSHPQSVPINKLVANPGTPLAEQKSLDAWDLVRCIATARIIMPKSMIRLSAGRNSLTDEVQALCFLAGANSIFYGDRLLTTDNQDVEQDRRLFAALGMMPVADPAAAHSADSAEAGLTP